MTRPTYEPGLRLLRLMMQRRYSEATIDTAAGLCLLAEDKKPLIAEMLEYLSDETHTEREFARMLSDKIKENRSDFF